MQPVSILVVEDESIVAEDLRERLTKMGTTVLGPVDADLILVGVSRSGKTPTCLYMALHFGVNAANYPLTPEDLENQKLPVSLRPHKAKIVGLTIDADRLADYLTDAGISHEGRHVERGNMQLRTSNGRELPAGVFVRRPTLTRKSAK